MNSCFLDNSFFGQRKSVTKTRLNKKKITPDIINSSEKKTKLTTKSLILIDFGADSFGKTRINFEYILLIFFDETIDILQISIELKRTNIKMIIFDQSFFLPSIVRADPSFRQAM
jgi:hypothetical protein